MRRALAVLTVLCLAFPAWAQLSNLGGEWKARITLLPSLDLGTSLTLKADIAGFTVTSTSEFAPTWGWIWQEFVAKGALGPIGIEGTVLFGPVIPDFLYAQLIYALELGGIEFNIYTAMLGAAVGGYFPPGPVGGAVIEFKAPLGATGLKAQLGFGASLPPSGFTIWHVSGSSKTYATSPFPGGLAFSSLLLNIEALPLCCGINLDVEFSFLKSGFDYIAFTLKDALALCCGVTVDVGVKFTTTAKTVTVTPKFAGFAEACFEVYADVVGTGMYVWQGIRVDGFKINCTLGDCNYLELVTFLSPDKAPDYDYVDVFDPDCGEFEYIGLGFCGAGCCGGKYFVDLRIFFGNLGGLFDLTRLVYTVQIPVMANFAFDLTGSIAAASCATTSLAIGWTFTF